MIEIFLIGLIVLFVMFYTGKINSNKFVEDNKDIFDILKESDYEFLLYAKYGDRVYDPEKVYMGRIKRAGIAFAVLFLIFMTRLNLSLIHI